MNTHTNFPLAGSLVKKGLLALTLLVGLVLARPFHVHAQGNTGIRLYSDYYTYINFRVTGTNPAVQLEQIVSNADGTFTAVLQIGSKNLPVSGKIAYVQATWGYTLDFKTTSAVAPGDAMQFQGAIQAESSEVISFAGTYFQTTTLYVGKKPYYKTIGPYPFWGASLNIGG